MMVKKNEMKGEKQRGRKWETTTDESVVSSQASQGKANYTALFLYNE